MDKKRIQNWLHESMPDRQTSGLLAGAFAAAVLVRLFLAYQLGDESWSRIDGEFLSIFTPDAALYGYYAKTLLEGLSHPAPGNAHLIEYLIFFATKYTPFHIDQVMFYGPAFLGAFAVVPVFLLAKMVTNGYFAAFAAVISTVGYGYYSRSYLGYFDTDVLNVFFPLTVLYLMVQNTLKPSLVRSFFIGAMLLLYLGWYHSSQPLVFALAGWYVLYNLVFDFKNPQKYQSFIIIALALTMFSWEYKLAAMAAAAAALHFVRIDYRWYLGLFALAGVAALLKIDFSSVLMHLERYVFRQETYQSGAYQFLYTMNLVAESRSYGFWQTLEHLAGNWFILAVSLLGYGWLVFKHRVMLLALPLAGLGFLSFYAGLRFHIYGVHVLIIAFVFAMYVLYKLPLKRYITLPAVAVLAAFALQANYASMMYWNTKVAQPVFSPFQVKVLEALERAGDREDFVVTWWDYGWPLWYYTAMNTLIDNGKHHQDNYIVSKIFTSTDQEFVYNAIHYFYELYGQNEKRSNAVTLAGKKDGDLKKVLEKLHNKDMAQKRTREKFVFVPAQMINSFFTMYQFGNIDISTGKKQPVNIFIEATPKEETERYINLSGGNRIDKHRGVVEYESLKLPIKQIIKVKNGKTTTTPGLKNGVSVIIYQKRFYIVDETMFNSFFVQLYFFNNYDKKYFEGLVLEDDVKLLRVRQQPR